MGGPPENGHVEGLGAVPTHNGWRANHAIPTEGGWIALESPWQGESEDCTIVMTRDRGGDPGGEKEKDVRKEHCECKPSGMCWGPSKLTDGEYRRAPGKKE